MAIDTNASGITISVDTGFETTESNAAVIRTVPVAREVTSPFDPAVLLMVAIALLEEDQVAHVVRSCVTPSFSVPEAENCFDVPLGILAVDGEEVMVATGDVVSREVPVSVLKDAEIVVVPGAATATADARPDALMPAMPVSDEDHAAHDVRIWVAALASIPTAANCCVIPRAMLGGLNGETDRETASDVVSTDDPVRPLYTAVMTEVPFVPETAVTSPALTVAIAWLDELQVADEVRFCDVPFE